MLKNHLEIKVILYVFEAKGNVCADSDIDLCKEKAGELLKEIQLLVANELLISEK